MKRHPAAARRALPIAPRTLLLFLCLRLLACSGAASAWTHGRKQLTDSQPQRSACSARDVAAALVRLENATEAAVAATLHSAATCYCAADEAAMYETVVLAEATWVIPSLMELSWAYQHNTGSSVSLQTAQPTVLDDVNAAVTTEVAEQQVPASAGIQLLVPDLDRMQYDSGVVSELALQVLEQPIDAVGPVHPRAYMLALFRMDILQQGGVQRPPQTWEELLTVMRTMNGTDMDGDGEGDWALCVDLKAPCKGHSLVMAVAASILQTRSYAQGLYLDPETLQPRTNSSGMRRALEVVQALLQFNWPGSLDTCGGISHQFLAARCAVTLDVDTALMFYLDPAASRHLHVSPLLAGNITLAQLPGSTEVWDASSDTLVNCTSRTCPLGEVLQAQPLFVTGRRAMLQTTAATAADGKDPNGRDQGSTDQGVLDQGSTDRPDQGIPDQGSTDQGSPDQGSADQGSADQGSPDQGSADQGSADQGSPDQGSADQGSADQGSPDQGSADQGSADQGSPDQGSADHGGSGGRADEGGSVARDSSEPGERKGPSFNDLPLGRLQAGGAPNVGPGQGFVRQLQQARPATLVNRPTFSSFAVQHSRLDLSWFETAHQAAAALRFGAYFSHTVQGYLLRRQAAVSAAEQRLAEGATLELASAAVNISAFVAQDSQRGGSADSMQLAGVYLRAYLAAYANRNAALDIAVPHAQLYRLLLEQAARNIITGTAIDDVMNNLTSSVAALTQLAAVAQDNGIQGIRARYWRTINYTREAAPQPPPTSPPNGSSGTLGAGAPNSTSGIGLFGAAGLYIAVLVPVVAVFTVPFIFCVVTCCNGKSEGKEVAPPAGPLTTLVYCCIQDFASLKRDLPDEVVTATLEVYHGVMRNVRRQHGGYAAAIEEETMAHDGAMLLAFMTPKAAACFATAAQLALQACCDWPAALLAHPDVCEQWAQLASEEGEEQDEVDARFAEVTVARSRSILKLPSKTDSRRVRADIARALSVYEEGDEGAEECDAEREIEATAVAAAAACRGQRQEARSSSNGNSTQGTGQGTRRRGTMRLPSMSERVSGAGSSAAVASKAPSMRTSIAGDKPVSRTASMRPSDRRTDSALAPSAPVSSPVKSTPAVESTLQAVQKLLGPLQLPQVPVPDYADPTDNLFKRASLVISSMDPFQRRSLASHGTTASQPAVPLSVPVSGFVVDPAVSYRLSTKGGVDDTLAFGQLASAMLLATASGTAAGQAQERVSAVSGREALVAETLARQSTRPRLSALPQGGQSEATSHRTSTSGLSIKGKLSMESDAAAGAAKVPECDTNTDRRVSAGNANDTPQQSAAAALPPTWPCSPLRSAADGCCTSLAHDGSVRVGGVAWQDFLRKLYLGTRGPQAMQAADDGGDLATATPDGCAQATRAPGPGTSGRLSGRSPFTEAHGHEAQRHEALGHEAHGHEGRPGCILVTRGLRVSMGIHVGVDEGDTVDIEPQEAANCLEGVLRRKRTPDRRYRGATLALARAIALAAYPGQVLMSAATFTQIRLPDLQGAVVVHMGDHTLSERTTRQRDSDCTVAAPTSRAFSRSSGFQRRSVPASSSRARSLAVRTVSFSDRPRVLGPPSRANDAAHGAFVSAADTAVMKGEELMEATPSKPEAAAAEAAGAGVRVGTAAAATATIVLDAPAVAAVAAHRQSDAQQDGADIHSDEHDDTACEAGRVSLLLSSTPSDAYVQLSTLNRHPLGSLPSSMRASMPSLRSSLGAVSRASPQRPASPTMHNGGGVTVTFNPTFARWSALSHASQLGGTAAIAGSAASEQRSSRATSTAATTGPAMSRLGSIAATASTTGKAPDTYIESLAACTRPDSVVTCPSSNRYTATALTRPKQSRGLGLYQLLDPTLASRLVLCHSPGDPCVRSCTQLTASTLDAPVGVITAAYLYVAGAARLSLDLPQVSEQCFALFHEVASCELSAEGGYLVEASGALVLAAFPTPESALRWCLSCQSLMVHQDWPAELLQHELGEAVRVWVRKEGGKMKQRTMCRGLRLKAGCDMGHVTALVNPTTGQMDYRGRTMNKAARVAALSHTGEVLCSARVWEAARGEEQLPWERPLEGVSTGYHHLKGLEGVTEIYQVLWKDQVPIAEPAALHLELDM